MSAEAANSVSSATAPTVLADESSGASSSALNQQEPPMRGDRIENSVPLRHAELDAQPTYRTLPSGGTERLIASGTGSAEVSVGKKALGVSNAGVLSILHRRHADEPLGSVESREVVKHAKEYAGEDAVRDLIAVYFAGKHADQASRLQSDAAQTAAGRRYASSVLPLRNAGNELGFLVTPNSKRATSVN